MKTIKFPKYSKLGTYEIDLLIAGIKENFTNLVRSIMTPGLIIRRGAGGVLGSEFQVTGTGPVNVNTGFLTYLDTGEIRVLNFPATSLTVDSMLYPNGVYYVCIIPKVTNYEASLVSFSNGSDVVAANIKKAFKNLRPFGSIIIENSDSLYGNGGVYKIISSGIDTVILDKPFTGTSEQNLKWKAGAEFPTSVTVNNTKERLAYEYDGYDLQIISSPKGYELAEIRITNGVATILRDRRASFLAEFNSNRANADHISSGSVNNITTIEEKAAAGRVDTLGKGLYTKGIRTGMTASIVGLDIMRVIAGDAINGNGKLIVVPQNVDLNIKTLADQSVVLTGTNYLHVLYKQPNTYEWFFSIAESNNAEHVLVTQFTYQPGGGLIE